MCGRKIIKAKVREYASMFDVLNVPDLIPNYNVAPTHMVPVVRLKPEEKTREMVLLQVGSHSQLGQRPGDRQPHDQRPS